MIFSLSDLFDNFEEKLLSLGVSSNFKNSPSWKSIVFNFKDIIVQTEISEKDKIEVHEEDKKIAFEYNNDTMEIDFSICCFGPNEIVCQIVNKKKLGVNAETNQEENILYIERVISELKDNSKVYVMFNYEGVLVNVYADKNVLTESFWSSFTLAKY